MSKFVVGKKYWDTEASYINKDNESWHATCIAITTGNHSQVVIAYPDGSVDTFDNDEGFGDYDKWEAVPETVDNLFYAIFYHYMKSVNQLHMIVNPDLYETYKNDPDIEIVHVEKIEFKAPKR